MLAVHMKTHGISTVFDLAPRLLPCLHQDHEKFAELEWMPSWLSQGSPATPWWHWRAIYLQLPVTSQGEMVATDTTMLADSLDSLGKHISSEPSWLLFSLPHLPLWIWTNPLKISHNPFSLKLILFLFKKATKCYGFVWEKNLSRVQ